jgi:hypothetical protein
VLQALQRDTHNKPKWEAEAQDAGRTLRERVPLQPGFLTPE